MLARRSLVSSRTCVARSTAANLHELQRPRPADGRIKSDALVFFGTTGDLAYKKIFPALQALPQKWRLNVPVVGVAKAG